MHIPYIGGIHDSDIVARQELCESRVRGNDMGLLGDCRSRGRLSMGQTDTCITGIWFHSDYNQCQDDSKRYPHGIGNAISDSRYLKTAQNLLHDAVNVKKALKRQCTNEPTNNSKEVLRNNFKEVTPTEKQILQKKMTKLSSMLNEVDRRYKHYYNQIQSVVSSFEEIAGCGASIPYTALTLQTISCKFRILKDAIKSQMEVISRRLGKTESNGEGIGIPRLRFVDQKVRRVQELGPMNRHHIWRPHRGLPESSVSILRAWLFEHFLHPYPKDSEKNMLATKTGLTRSQVANWFINARVRLWKPMVEEMYKQESMHASSSSPKKPSLNQALVP